MNLKFCFPSTPRNPSQFCSRTRRGKRTICTGPDRKHPNTFNIRHIAHTGMAEISTHTPHPPETFSASCVSPLYNSLSSARLAGLEAPVAYSTTRLSRESDPSLNTHFLIVQKRAPLTTPTTQKLFEAGLAGTPHDAAQAELNPRPPNKDLAHGRPDRSTDESEELSIQVQFEVRCSSSSIKHQSSSCVFSSWISRS